MTFEELSSTLAEVLAGGQIGTPVSLRLHLQLASGKSDSSSLLASVMPVVESVFGQQPDRLMARKNVSADQLSVLLEYAGGQTCFVTCGRLCASEGSLQFLLFGNRGQVRLEGAELLEANSIAHNPADDRWRARIEASLAANGPVPVA